MFRRIVSVVLACAIALEPVAAAAQQMPYYRHNRTTYAGPVTPPTPPNPTNTDPVRGTGELAIYLPVQVRARYGVPFSLQLRAQNGEGDVTWTSVGTALPEGLTFNPSTGFLTGVPTRIQTSPKARFAGVDATGKTGESPSLIIDVQPVPTVAVEAVYTGQTGTDLAIRPVASPVFGSQAWTLAGNLPLGLSLDPNTGRITGTPRQQGTYANLKLSVTDADGASGTSAAFTINVTSNIAITGLPSKIPARLARAMTPVRVFASGTPGPYQWSVSAEGASLPEGLALNPTTGAISGTPVASGSTSGVALRIVDTRTGESTISPPFTVAVADAPSISVAASYTVRQGRGSVVNLVPVGNNLLAGGYWSATSKPPGYGFEYSTGAITGPTGSVASYAGITFKVIDMFDGASATSSATTLNIWPELTVGGPAIPAAKVNTPFSMQPPVASGLMGVPTWSVIGALPDGLTLNPATGVISGTPTKVSRLRVSMSLADGADKATASTLPFDINIQPEDAELPFEIVGVPAQIPGVTERFMSFTPTVTGAKGAVTWSLAGTLPSWALFEPSTGSIAGVPTTTGVTSGLVLSVSDASTGATVSSSPFALEITPNAPMTVAIAESMQGEVAETFAGASPVVRNSRGTTSFALAAGRAPEGLQLNPETGSFQGIPEISGTVSGLSILATDNFGSAAVSNPFAVNVAPSATSPVATMASRTATTHEPFSAAPSARNAFAPLSWVLESGSLPSWATFNPTTGAISGTPPQTGLSGPFVLKVTDRFGRAARTSEFSISTVDAPAFSISMAPTVYGVAGSTFVERPIVIGAKGATTFTLTAGTLPAGLTLSPDTGAINGSPNASGLTNGLRISAKDTTNAVVSTDAFSISVSPSPLKVSEYPSELRSTYQVAYTAPRPQVSGIVGSAVWTLANGTLPSWATLDSETGQISGTPDAVATASGLRLRVADSNGTNATTGFFSLVAARPTLSAGSHGALAYHIGEPTTIPAPAARGVVGAPTWTLTSGTLPAGLTLDPSTGVISGAVASPLTASNLILTVRDAFDGATASTPAFSIAMLGAPVVTVLPTYQGSRGASFEALPAVTNAIGAQAWTLVSGSLPAWATFDATTGRIGGTPQEVSSATGLIVRMTDATGAVAQSEPFSIVVGAGMYATTQSTTYNPRVGIAFATDAPQVFKNAGAVTWSIASGSLPAWATLNAATGIISGTADTPSQFTIVLRLTDASSASATTQPLTFDATGVPVVSIASKSLRVGAPLTLAPVVTGAVGEQFWQVVTGALPAWMKLDARTGLLTGSPTEIGSVTLALQVRDEDGAVGTSAAFTITVTPGLTIAGKAPSYGGRINQLFSMAPVTIGNAQGALSWTMAIGSSMPGGLIYNESNGTLSGRPANSGTMTANLVVRDASDQATLNVSLNLVIAQELTISEPVTASFHEGQAFATRALAVTGQRGTLSWKLVGGTLPAWATFATETGIISGIAPNAITSVGPLVITVTDSEDQITSPSVSFLIEIIPGLGVANLPTSFSARFGTLFTSARPTAVSPVGAPVWSWGQGSAPPAWLNLDPATGILSGTPVALGSFSGLTLVVKDATNQIASSAPFTLSVFSQPSIAVSESTLKRRVGDMVSITSTATGLSGTPRWSVVLQPGSDPIPAGLVFNEQTGSVSGTPTAAGSAFFLIRVVDGQDLAVAESQMISLTVSPAFSLTGMASSYFGRVGEFLILDQPTAQGQAGQGVAYSFTLREGVLPAGFGMVDNTTGLIRGVPSLPLQTTIGTLSATDSFDQKTAATSFTIGIRPALSVAGVTDVALRNDQAVGTSTFTPAAQNLFYPGTAQWTLSGTLPNGVTFNSSNGTLSGTPTGYAASQTFAGLTLTLKDPTDGSQVTSAPFKVTVNTGISLQTTQPSYTVRAGRQFVAAAPTISGLSGTGTWSIVTRAGSALPYTIAANGAVTVSPSASANGGWAYDLIVTDPVDGNTSAVAITATVAPVTVLAYQGNTAVAPGQQVSIPASVSNNRGTLQFSLASGTLPGGITLDGTTGLISGSSSALGSVTVTVKAIDIDGYEAVSGAVRIAVSNAPDVFVGGIPSGKIGKPFVLAPTTNAASVTWSMTGTLPAGLSFNSATGAITGQPTAVGTSGSIVISARNTATSVTGASEAFTITVVPGNAISVASEAAKWRQGLAASTKLSIANAVGAVSWTITGGVLPAGVSLNSQTGEISGLPTQFGPHSVSLRTVDAEGAVATYTYSLNTAVGPTVNYGTVNMRPGVTASVTPIAQNLVGTATFEIRSGSLPAGLAFNTSTGLISGTPEQATSSPVALRVRITDADGAFGESSFSLVVSANAFVVDAGGSSFAATVGQPFSLQPVAYLQTQAVNQYVVWAVQGKLPVGLKFDTITGRITGTPAPDTVGTTTFSISATYNSQSSSTSNLTLVVTDRVAPTASFGAATYSARRGEAFSIQPTSQNTVGTIIWYLASGTLPIGMSLNEQTGVLSGVPSRNGPFTFALKVADVSKIATTQSVTVTVQDGMSVAFTEVTSNTRVGKIYLANATVTGASGAVTWSVTQGTLPTGLSINPLNGTIAGAPAQIGTWKVTVRALDETGASKEVPVSIAVGSGPSVGSISQQTALVGAAYSFTPSSSSTVPTVQWSVEGTLPAGLALSNSSTGAITGTPTTAGTSNDLRLVLTDGDGLVAKSAVFSITVAPASSALTATMPPTVNFVQGQSGSVSATVAGAIGPTQSYAIQLYGYNPNRGGYFWNDQTQPGAPVLPTGLLFNTTTGVLSGTPTTTLQAASAYRIVVTDNRTPAVAVTSNQFVIAITPWQPVVVNVSPNYALTRGQEFSIAPAVSGNVGTTSYTLQVYAWNSANQVSRWNDLGTNGTPALVSGMNFSTTTGVLSGTISVANPASTGIISYRIVARDGRSEVGTSRQFTLALADWAQPTVTVPRTQQLTRGQPIEIVPTVTNVIGSKTFVLQIYGYNPNSGSYFWNMATQTGAPTLPVGLSFDATTGTISGTPTTATGNSNAIAYRVVMNEIRDGQTISVQSNQMVFTYADWVLPAISIDQTVSVTRGAPAAITPTVTGVSGTVTYVLDVYGYNSANGTSSWSRIGQNGAPALPDGLIFNSSTGAITGIPNGGFSAYAQAFRISGTETRSGQSNTFSSNSFTIAVSDWPAPTLVYPNRTLFVVNQPLVVQPEITGLVGTAQYVLMVYGYNSGNGTNQWMNLNQSGAPTVHPGLSFNSSTGVISGTPTALSSNPPGAYRVTMTETRVINGTNQTRTVTSRQFTLAGSASASTAPALAYGVNGSISGTVNGALDAAPTLMNASAVTGAYTLQFGTTVTFNQQADFTQNSLPGGITFNASTGRFTASAIAPAAAGNWRGYRVCAPTASGTACTPEIVFAIADRPAVTMQLPTYVDASLRESVSVTPVIQNAVGAVTFTLAFNSIPAAAAANGEVIQGTLPSGLAFDAATGTISGAPTVSGVFRGYKITARDSQGASYAATSGEIIFRVAPAAAFTVSVPAVTEWQQGAAVAIQPTAANAYGTVTWNTNLTQNMGGVADGVTTFIGALPTGLSYTAATGSISGTVAYSVAPGTYRGYQICGRDESNRNACSPEFAILIKARPALAISAPAIVYARPGEAVTVNPVVANAIGAMTWAANLTFNASTAQNSPGETQTSSLPNGLSYSSTTGVISGTLAANVATGRWRGYKVAGRDTATASNVTSDEIIFEISPADPLVISQPLMLDLVRGQPFTLTPRVSGTMGSLTWDTNLTTRSTSAIDGANGDIVQSALPGGLSYAVSGGVISGTVSATATVGRWRGYKVCASDARGRVCSDEFTLSVR